jgi:hypothetical protein
MHPLHDYIGQRLAEKLKERRIVVWYDPRGEFAPFVQELRGDSAVAGGVARVVIGGLPTNLAEYAGSYFEVRAVVEPLVSADTPDYTLIYLPGCDRDTKGSVLMELEEAGARYEPQLKQLARIALLKEDYTESFIAELTAPDSVGYADLARLASGAASREPPSLLRTVFHEPGDRDILSVWLMNESKDAEIENRQATTELRKLVSARLGLELPSDAGLGKLRWITARYVLAGEFRSDLRCAPPSALNAVPAPPGKEQEGNLRKLAKRMRDGFAGAYPALANRVETELGLSHLPIAAEHLGSIDTFRFEERVLLAHCGELIAQRKFDEALAVIAERENSFWLIADLARKAQWKAARHMAELGRVAKAVKKAVSKAGDSADAWIHAYTTADQEGGGEWYELDQAQRRLEAWLTTLDEDPDERPLGVVRQDYEDVCHLMAKGFAAALAKETWTTSAALHQTRIYGLVAAGQPAPMAYFLVDALRFEMGVELRERLPGAAEVSLRPALGALPSITPIGMAALLPGASASFSVVEHDGKLGARVEGTFLPDLAARKKFAAARVPDLVDIPLDDVLNMPLSRLRKKVEGARMVLVRSGEIDAAGEGKSSFQARHVMDYVIDNLARAIRKLANAGVAHSVVTADHGHLFFGGDRDESMQVESPGGRQVELHRRCWIGKGGATPRGCLRLPAPALGYDSDLEFVFPPGTAVFKAGGELAYHHGGPSLQELMIPVLTIRLASAAARPKATPVSAAGLPEVITNRIFSVTLNQDLALFASAMSVRPLLMSGGRQVGAVGMVVDAEVDAAGCVKLQPGKSTTVAFLLSDETAPSLTIVVLDPATDAPLYSSQEIPVRLGV